MDGNEILLLGLGIQEPWRLVDQCLDVDKQPHELHLTVRSDRGQKYACPVCGAECAAHDFQEKTWRHLNFFQHHCYIHASVPRVKCPEHGVKLTDVPWARKGSAFALLLEQAALTLVREMPVYAAARIIEITDKRLWRIVEYYVATGVRRAPCKVGAFPAGAKPVRPLSLRPVAIGAVMEVTKWLKPSV